MKEKKTLQKVTMAAGVVAMSVGLFNALDSEARQGGGCDCPEVRPGTYICTDEHGNEWGYTMSTRNEDWSCGGTPSTCRVNF